MRTTPILAALVLALAGHAAAQFTPMATAVPDSVPGGMNYQGRLEKDGFPVTGTKTMAFRLYDASSGGTALYNSGNLSVSVQQGLFSVALDIPFGALTGIAQKYLELEVEGAVLTPRDPLRSVPYAKVAETVEGTINISTAGLTFTTNAGDSLAISSGSGRVGIGTASPLARLHVSSGTGETGVILLVSTGATALATIDGNGVVAANHFSGGFATIKGTLTVQGGEFSVGATSLVVGTGRTGVGTAAPLATLSVAGDSSFSQPATFLSSVTVASSAQFGSGATRSTFSTAGALAIPGSASLAVGSTFFVDGANGRVGVGTGSPSASAKLHVVGGDVLIGNPTVHDTSGDSDLLVQGNFILDGKMVQHTGSPSVFNQLGVAAEPQAGQTFAVGYTSFNVTSAGLVGIGTVSPGAKLTLAGDQSVSQSATFASSITVLGPNRLLGGFMDPATFNSSLTVVGENRLKGGFIETATFASSLTVRAAAGFGTGAGTTISAAGALAVTSGQNITVAGGAQLLGLPASPAATGSASKEYVDSQTLVGSGWTRDAGGAELELSFAGDDVGIGTTAPGAKLEVVGTVKVSGAATFASSITVRNAAGFGTTGQSSFGSTGVLTLGTALATTSGGTGSTTGEAPTATALAGNGANCGAGNAPLGVDQSGASESCFDVGTQVELDAHAALTNPHSATNLNTASRIVLRDGSGNFSAGTITAALTGNVAGNATTATGLASDPADCTLPNVALGINTAGTAQCSTPSNVTGNAATATALAADPAACGAGQFTTDIAANGTLTCAAVGAASVGAGTLGSTVVAQTVQAAGGTRLFSRTIVQLLAVTPAAVGEIYFCNNCAPAKVVVSTATGAGNFADVMGGSFQ